MLSTKEVIEILVPFVKNAFEGKIVLLQNAHLKRNFEENVFALLKSSNTLTSIQVSKLQPDKQKILYELLTQYLIFFTTFTDLTFPDYFLLDCSENQLGKHFLEYIVEHSWPFPQMLPH